MTELHLAPNFPIEGVTYHDPGRARRHLAAGNWLNLSVGDSLRATAATTPDKAAVIGPAERLTCAELDAQSESVAASLLDAGLSPGDRVLFQLGTGVSYFVAFYGCMKAGVVPVCTLPQYRMAEMQHFARITEARAILTDAEAGARFDQTGFGLELAAACPVIRHVIAVGGEHDGALSLRAMAHAFDPVEARQRTEHVRPGIMDVAVFQLSGGSTSLPKIIPRMHGEYLGATLQLSARYGLTGSDVSLWGLPLVHNAGTLFAVLPVGLEGRTLVLQPRLDMPEMLRLVAEHRVTFSGSIGPVAAKLLEVPDLHRYDISSLRQFFSLTRAAAVEAHVGKPVGQMFGMTEGMVFAAHPDTPAALRHHTVGYPVSPADEVRLLAPGEETEAPFGAVGELCFRGPSTLTAYFADPATTAASFTKDGLFRSGDLMRKHEIGGIVCYSFEGRLKDNINRGGEKIGAEEIESLIARHPDVADCRVVAMPDPMYGEKACAFLILREDCPAPTVASLGAFLLQTGIAKFKLPERVEVLDAFPLTRVGKVDKVSMRAMAAQLVTTDMQAAVGG